MPAFKSICSLSILFLFLSNTAACATKEINFFEKAPIQINPVLTQKGNLSYAYLMLESAIRKEDVDGVRAAAQILLEYDPKNTPLQDVAAWYLMSGYPSDARDLLLELIKMQPDDFNLLLMLAETFVEEGTPNEAVTILKNYIQEHPENPAAQVDLAILYLKINQLELANDIFASLPESQKTPTVRYFYAQSLNNLGQFNKARQELTKAVAEQNDFLEAMAELAAIEENQGNYKEARQWYEKLYKFDETNQDILLRLIKMNILENKLEKAFELAQTMPDSLGFLLTVASNFMEEGKYDLAKRIVNFAEKQNPNHEEILFFKAAIAYEAENDIPKALDYLAKVQEQSSNYNRALHLTLELAIRLENWENAIKTANKGITLFPDDREFALIALQILNYQGKTKEALELGEIAMESLTGSDENYSDIEANLIYNYAVLLIMQKQTEASIPFLERVLLIDSEHVESMNSLAYIFADENKNLPRALELALKANELSPDKAYILDTLAWVQYKTGQYEQAWESIRKAVSIEQEQSSSDPTILDHYAKIAVELGYINKAIQAWESALLLKPESPEKLLKELEKYK